jgi:hypothetical protein
VTDTRTLVLCPDCRTHWVAGHEAARCTDPGHTHQHFEVHRHRTEVALPDGAVVTAASFDPVDPYGRDRVPDYGLYFDPRWQPPWPHDHLDWPDFGVPEETGPLARQLRTVLERARAGDRVEVGCLGGHGRTGTALACLGVLAGLPAAGAVAWVRATYCADAVETADQEAFVAAFGS